MRGARWLLHVALIAAIVFVSEWSHAETIAATPTVVSNPTSGWFYKATDITCAGVVRYSQAEYIYLNVAQAAAAMPQSALNYASRATWGSQYCDDPLGTAIRGAVNESNLTMAYQVVWNGNVTGNASVVFSRITGSCPSGWQASGSNCTRTSYSCPSTGGWTLSGTSCTRPDPPQCPAGQKPGYLGLGCVPDNECENRAATTGVRVVSQRVTTVCETGCVLSPATFNYGADGRTVMYPPYTLVREGCDVSGAPSVPAGASAPAGVQPGSCLQTINAAEVMVPCASSGTNQTTTGTSSSTSASGVTSSGSNTTITRSVVCNTGGTACQTITTTTVTNPDGSKTVTIGNTTGAPDGNGTGNTGTGTGNGGGGEGSSFGGACASTTCTGDAIQCAIAKEQAKRACELLGDGGPAGQALADIGNAAATGDLTPVGHPGRDPEVVDLGLSGRIDQTPLFGASGACPADVPVVLLRQVVWFRFSSMCPWLHLIGQCLVMLSMLIAARIVFKGF